MRPDDQSAWPATEASHSDTVRRQVIDAVGDLLRGSSDVASVNGSPGGRGAVVDPVDQSAVTLYLVLLQDRLPVYARAIQDLSASVGRDDVAGNLASAARATIGFYSEILATKVSILANPDQLLQLRHVFKSHDLGPHAAHEAVAAYLEGERRLGRIAADVDCGAAARLLIGACVNHAFMELLLGEAPPDDEYVTEIITGLRIGHCHGEDGDTRQDR